MMLLYSVLGTRVTVHVVCTSKRLTSVYRGSEDYIHGTEFSTTEYCDS